MALNTDKNTFSNDKHSSKLIEPGIIENTIMPGVHIEVNDIQEIKSNNLGISKGRRYVVLVTSGFLSSISKEARELTASKEFVINTLAKAILVENPGHQLIGNFYLNINKPSIKTKLFTDRAKAIRWLRVILNKKNIVETDWINPL